MIARNPADATSPPPSKAKEMKTLTPEEVESLLVAAKDSEYYPVIFTAVWTGMRRSELLGLRWRDLDLVLGWISVTQITHRLRAASHVSQGIQEAAALRFDQVLARSISEVPPAENRRNGRRQFVDNHSKAAKAEALGIPRSPLSWARLWSQRTDSNRRPAVYETAALPLSYVG